MKWRANVICIPGTNPPEFIGEYTAEDGTVIQKPIEADRPMGTEDLIKYFAVETAKLEDYA